MAENLKAGFTGAPFEPTEGIRRVAQTATDALKRETNALAVGATDHPNAATTVVLAIGALAFAVGYVIGRSYAESQTYWR